MDNVESEKPPVRVCILNFSGNSRDWGCQASSWELVRVLNRHWSSQQPFALDVIPALPANIFGRVNPDRHLMEIRDALLKATPTAPQKRLIEDLILRHHAPLAHRIERADVIFLRGDSAAHAMDLAGAVRALLLPWLAKHLHAKRVIAVNSGWYASDTGIMQFASAVASGFERIGVQQPQSTDSGQNYAIGQPAPIPDTAFLTDPLMHGQISSELISKDYFCVAASSALDQNSIPGYLDSIRAIAAATDLLPLLVCSDRQDMRLNAHAHQHWPEHSFAEVPPRTIYAAVAEILGKARFLVGGQHQLAALAAIGGTPSILIGTDNLEFTDLKEILGVDWSIRQPRQRDDLVADACNRLACLSHTRPILKRKVSELREQIVSSFAHWHDDHHHSRSTNQQAAGFAPTDKALVPARHAEQQQILPQLNALTVYLRRGVQTEASFRCLRQLIEGNLDLALAQLNTRWLISICDSYADFGNPLECRNALLISTFINWERLASTYVHCADPDRETRKLDHTIPGKRITLWDGLQTVNLNWGDTTNNLLKRYSQLLECTPPLLRIWHAILERVRTNDSILAALNAAHGHLFDENLDWLAEERYADDVPVWRRSGL